MVGNPIIFLTRVGVDSSDGGGYACFHSSRRGYYVPIPELIDTNDDEEKEQILQILRKYNASYDSIMSGVWGPDRIRVPEEIASATEEFIKKVRKEELVVKDDSTPIRDDYRKFIPHYDPLIDVEAGVGAYGVNCAEYKCLQKLLLSDRYTELLGTPPGKRDVYIVFLTTLQGRARNRYNDYTCCGESKYFRAFYAVAALKVEGSIDFSSTTILLSSEKVRSDVDDEGREITVIKVGEGKEVKVIRGCEEWRFMRYGDFVELLKKRKPQSLGILREYDDVGGRWGTYVKLIANHIHVANHIYVLGNLTSEEWVCLSDGCLGCETIYFGKAMFLKRPVPVLVRDTRYSSLKLEPVEQFRAIRRWGGLNDYYRRVCVDLRRRGYCKRGYCCARFHQFMASCSEGRGGVPPLGFSVLYGDDSREFIEALGGVHKNFFT